nr:MAG TPA: endopeptidase tail [Caudoviricetes sp.]
MYRVNTIFVLNRQKEIIDVIPSQGDSCFFDDEYELDLETFMDTYTLSVKDVKRYSDKLIGLNYIIFRFKGKDRLFQIFESGTTHEKKNVITDIYCENTGITLINEPTQPQVIVGNVKQFLEAVLINTEFAVGYVDSELLNTVLTIEIESKTNVLKAIQDNIASFGAELEFTVKRQGSKLKQIINVYKKKGKVTNKIFTYGDNANKIGQTKKWSDFCTALIPYGKDDITIHSVEWIKEKGDPVDKPLNQDFIADEEAFKLYNNDGRHIFGYFESDANNASDLLKEAYEELQKRSKPQATYEMSVSYDDELDIGDTVSIRDFSFGVKPLLLEARVNKLKLSFSDETKCTAEFSNFKEVISKIKNLSNKDDLLKEIIEFLGGIGIGDLTDEDIAKIREYLEKMGVEKEEIDKIFDEIQDIIHPKPDPPDEGDGDPIYLTSYKNGVWLGDDRFHQVKTSKTVSTTDKTNDKYAEALALYEKYDIGKYQNKANLNDLSSTGNKYKLYLIVEHYARKFGLDTNLVYAVIMGESRGDPYSTTGSNGGYGLMQCERSTYFKEWGNKAQTIKYLDGSTYKFLPSYNTMKPGAGGTTTVNGITVDRNILNQIRFGCWELRQAIDYAHGNIFGGLVANNMGQGSLNWIVSKYVCDKYGYTFVDSYYLSSQSNETKLKVYEELDSGKFDFAAYRQKLKDQKGLGTPNNVELYLCWYKVVNGQLPYYLDAQGNKLGYGVGTSTPKAKGQTSASDIRQIIVDTAKAIVQQHTDKLATYDQSYRTWNFKKPNKRKGTFYGIKNPICYDCSSLVTCCYGEAGLKSIFHSDSLCAAGTLVDYATRKSGYTMFKITKTTIENMLPGDIIMMCNKECPTTLTRAKAMAYKFTHHTLIYCGKVDGTHMVAHARQWDYWPKAIRYMAVYSDIYKYGFCLRPYDLVEADNNNVEDTPVIDKTDMNEVYIKAVRKANAYDFYDDNNNLLTTVEGLYEDDEKVYPSSIPYALVHFGLNDLTEKGINGVKILVNILKNKYRNTPIFILKELHTGIAYENYATVNTSIDTYNTQIKEFCDNEENVFLLDVSDKLETYIKVLNSNYTNDGYTFKDDSSIGVFYNAIKEKLLATPIGYKKKDDSSEGDTSGGDDDDKPSENEGKTINVVLKATQMTDYELINGLTFKLPSKVAENFYARIKFTTTDDFKYSQSKICYIEGDDCKSGQLLPKSNTTYKLIIMKNVNSDIDYKYYASAYKEVAGTTTTKEKDFIGGKKVVEIAKTFLNHSELEYSGWKSTTATSTPASFKNPSANLSRWYDSERKKYQIDCSTLSMYTFMGLKYDKTPYKNNKMTKVKRNTAYSWAITLPRLSADQARYCVEHGWVLHDADTTNFLNLKEGDLIFYDRDKLTTTRYMQISHVAICVGEVNGVMSCIESTKCDNGVRIIALTKNTPDKVLFVARPKKS